jgi:iron complex outermembrane recepter protein
MIRPSLLRGASAGALAVVLFSSLAPAQEALPAIDIGAARLAASNAAPAQASAPTSAKERAKAEEHAYTRTSATTATKTDTPILDTPRSVAVVPQQVLEDNQVTTVQESVKFVSGVQSNSPYYDIFYIRGLSTAQFTYRNGLKFVALQGTTDPAFVERVEIVKGPASMLYGRVQPGGIVNFVPKTPKEEAAYSIQEQFGSWGLSRTTVDATGPLNKDKSLLYRVVGVFDRADDFVQFRQHNDGMVLAELAWKPTTNFESNLQFEYYNKTTDNAGIYGQQIPAMALSYAVPGIVGRPANVPRSWSSGDPGMYGNQPDTLQRELVYADWTYHINDSWKVTNRFQYDHAVEHGEYIVSQAFNAATGNDARQLQWENLTRDEYSLNLDLNGEVVTGPLKHKLLVGFDYFDQEAVNKGDNPAYATAAVPTINVFAPVYAPVAWPILAAENSIALGNIWNRVRQLNYGYYFQDDINYEDKIHLLVGGREDIAYDAQSELHGVSNYFYGATASGTPCFPICDGHFAPPWKGTPTERKFSPNAGLLFKVTPEYSVFSSYSQSFGTSNASSASYDGTAFKPQEAWQYEVGGKASLLDGKLNASVTAFDLHLLNVLSPDPLHTGYSVATGEVRSMGIEGDISGQVTDNISLIGSYTYDDAIILKDNTAGTGATQGKRYLDVPRHAGNIWAKYDSAPGKKEGWMFGAGVYANGERQGNNQNSWQMPGYWRTDAMLGYRTVLQGVPVEAQLNIINLNDAKYFEAALGNYAYYGAPRTFKGSIKVKF